MGRNFVIELERFEAHLRVNRTDETYLEPTCNIEPRVSLLLTSPSSQKPELKPYLNEWAYFKLISEDKKYLITFSISREILSSLINSWANMVNNNIPISISPGAKRKFTEAEINKVIEDTLQEYRPKP